MQPNGKAQQLAGKLEPARSQLELSLQEPCGIRHWGQCVVLANLAAVPLDLDDPGCAREMAEEGLGLAEQTGFLALVPQFLVERAERSMRERSP